MLKTDEDRKAADDLVMEILRDVGPFAAVKEYRALSGLSLRESANHLARICPEYGLKVPDTFR